MEIQKQNDTLVHALLFGSEAYAVALSARETVQAAQDIHGLSKTTTAAFGRLMMGALILASDIKSKTGDVTVTFDGGGPAGRAVAVASADGKVRVTAINPQADLPVRLDGKLDVAGVLGNSGRITIIKDNGAEPYIGQVQITSGEVAEDFAYYYALSEQRPCLIFLGVTIDVDQSVLSAGGLAVFPFPDCDSRVIDTLEESAGLLGQLSSMLAKGQDLMQCLHVIFQGMDMKITQEIPLSYHCPCSKDRMERALISLGRSELQDIMDKDEQAELVCHFCNKRYCFNKNELQVLWESAGR